MFEDCLERLLEVHMQEKLAYVGNCVTILDDSGAEKFQDRVASDATQLQGVVDGGKKITLGRFMLLTIIDPTMVKEEFQKKPDRYSFWYNKKYDLAWYRDEDEDIEYFYW